MKFDPIPDAIAAIAAGRAVVVVKPPLNLWDS